MNMAAHQGSMKTRLSVHWSQRQADW